MASSITMLCVVLFLYLKRLDVCLCTDGTLGMKTTRICFSPSMSAAIVETVNVNIFLKRKPDGKKVWSKPKSILSRTFGRHLLEP